MDAFNNKNFKINSTPGLGISDLYGDMNQGNTGRYFDGLVEPWQSTIGGLVLSEAEKQIRLQALKYESEQRSASLHSSPTRTAYNFSPSDYQSPFPIVGISFSADMKENAGDICRETSQERNGRGSLKRHEVNEKVYLAEALQIPQESHTYENETNLTVQTGKKNSPKKIKKKPIPREGIAGLPCFRYMKFSKKIGLCLNDHPRVIMTDPELHSLSLKILNRILSPEGQRVRPRFFGKDISDGCLMLVCGDETTVSWVKSLPEKLKGPNGMRLRAVEEPETDGTFTAVADFPDSGTDSNSRILQFLAIQNKGLDMSRWKILKRVRVKEGGVQLTFSIDSASAKTLTTKGPSLNYKFSCAKFRLKPPKDTNPENCKRKDCNKEEFSGESRQMPTEFLNPFAFTQVRPSTWEGESFPRNPAKETLIPDFITEATVTGTSKNPFRYSFASKQLVFRNRNSTKRCRMKKKKKKQEAVAAPS